MVLVVVEGTADSADVVHRMDRYFDALGPPPQATPAIGTKTVTDRIVKRVL
jgi:hypothetical protein